MKSCKVKAPCLWTLQTFFTISTLILLTLASLSVPSDAAPANSRLSSFLQKRGKNLGLRMCLVHPRNCPSRHMKRSQEDKDDKLYELLSNGMDDLDTAELYDEYNDLDLETNMADKTLQRDLRAIQHALRAVQNTS